MPAILRIGEFTEDQQRTLLAVVRSFGGDRETELGDFTIMGVPGVLVSVRETGLAHERFVMQDQETTPDAHLPGGGSDPETEQE
jgi:hypothetical protein